MAPGKQGWQGGDQTRQNGCGHSGSWKRSAQLRLLLMRGTGAPHMKAWTPKVRRKVGLLLACDRSQVAESGASAEGQCGGGVQVPSQAVQPWRSQRGCWGSCCSAPSQPHSGGFPGAGRSGPRRASPAVGAVAAVAVAPVAVAPCCEQGPPPDEVRDVAWQRQALGAGWHLHSRCVSPCALVGSTQGQKTGAHCDVAEKAVVWPGGGQRQGQSEYKAEDEHLREGQQSAAGPSARGAGRALGRCAPCSWEQV